MDQVVAHNEIISTCKVDSGTSWLFALTFSIFVVSKFVKEGKLPHLLFYGPPGTGKTSTAVALAHTIFGKFQEVGEEGKDLFLLSSVPPPIGGQFNSSKVLELNASDERGIEVVREQIKTFASTKTFANANGSSGAGSDLKLIILDEADAMTGAAQNALRRVMEKHVRNVRFVIICNYVGQIIPALQSRCTRFRFAPLPLECLRDRIAHVAAGEGIVVEEAAKEALIRIANGDMRRVLNVLQAASAAFSPAPITEDAIYAVTAAPHPADMKRILDCLLNEELPSAHAQLSKLQKERALALADVIREVFELLGGIHLPVPMRIFLTQRMAEIE